MASTTIKTKAMRRYKSAAPKVEEHTRTLKRTTYEEATQSRKCSPTSHAPYTDHHPKHEGSSVRRHTQSHSGGWWDEILTGRLSGNQGDEHNTVKA